MKAYDLKTGHSLSWNREFKFAGRTQPPSGEFISTNDESGIYRKMQGAYFLAGKSTPAKVLYCGETEQWMDFYIGASEIKGIACNQKVGLLDFIVVCGPVVENPERLSEICSRYPVNRIYVCPLVDELEVFGCLVDKLCREKLEMPRRANLCEPNREPLDFPCKQYDSVLQGDAWGRLAHGVSSGSFMYNQIMNSAGVSAFYDKLIASIPIFKENVFIVSSDLVGKYFPSAPVSAKRHAATSVPVAMNVSEKFKKDTGWRLDKANVLVASDFIEGLGTFMRFYKIMTGKDFVVSGAKGQIELRGIIPLFRCHGVYIPKVEEVLL
jgi:hypothetical protein